MASKTELVYSKPTDLMTINARLHGVNGRGHVAKVTYITDDLPKIDGVSQTRLVQAAAITNTVKDGVKQGVYAANSLSTLGFSPELTECDSLEELGAQLSAELKRWADAATGEEFEMTVGKVSITDKANPNAPARVRWTVQSVAPAAGASGDFTEYGQLLAESGAFSQFVPAEVEA